MEILNYLLSLSFTFWLLFLTVVSGMIYIIDYLFFQRSRLAPYKNQLKKLKKKERRQFYRDNGIRAPFIADQSRSLFSVFIIVFFLT